MGVDGLRLDAIPYLYERDGTNCENLPETHAFLKKLRAHVDGRFEDRMLLAEANQWPEDAAEYFGDGDECHMNFHFPIMPRLFMALRMEDRFPIIDILEQTPEIPERCQWAVFLRNHDELTLEMVTDEERDYMYRVYAHDTTARINLGIRRRLAPLLENSRRKIELMNSLLLSLPGTPVLYYGDEIGMGDNFYLGDRHGVRTPMQWSGDRNAGFSSANPQRLFLPVIIDPEYHYESVNVEAQHLNPSSHLWWTRRIIALRKRHPAFGRGDFAWVEHDNKRVLAFLREHEGDRILVVANLSRFAQSVSLELKDDRGRVPVELFGRTPFPPVTDEPYPLTLGPHTFYWFLLRTREEVEGRHEGTFPGLAGLPVLRVHESWQEVLHEPVLEGLHGALLPFLFRQRWFAGKGREVRQVEVEDVIPVEPLHPDPGPESDDAASAGRLDDEPVLVLIVRVDYLEADPERYVVPLFRESRAEAERRQDRHPGSIVARVRAEDGSESVLFDAAGLPGFGRRLLHLIRSRATLDGAAGRLRGVADAPDAFGSDEEDDLFLDPRMGSAEQSNTSLVFGHRWIFKLFRRLEDGVNLDREVGRFLTQRGFEHTPAVAGGLEYQARRRAVPGADTLRGTSLAVLQRFVSNEGDAWDFTMDALGRYFERVLASPVAPGDLPLPTGSLVEAAGQSLPEEVHDLVDEAYLDSARLLGRRTGELHRKLATVGTGGSAGEAAFTPQEFSTLYQRSLYQSMRNLLGHTYRTLRAESGHMEGEERARAHEILERRADLLARFRRILDRKLDGERIRVHGDYHLGQVLWTGKDFVIIDFEGEPSRPLSERRLKRSPLRDVAGMLRSFHYASMAALFRQRDQGATPSELEDLEAWTSFWYRWVAVAFLRGYLEAAEDASFLPGTVEGRQLLLDLYLLEKALYELGYEAGNRPGWMRIPMEGILALLDGEPDL
jgi:maltose alpha-D-glucosyltransferase/alpha-amylase